MALDALTGFGTYRDQPGGVAATPAAVEATIATTPAVVGDDVYVFLDVERARLAPDQAAQRVGPCRWQPRPVDSGLLFPKRDDPCLVVMSDHGRRTIVWWAPKTAAPLADAWHEIGTAGEPAFQNAWANRGGTEATAAYRLLPAALVTLKGSVKTGVSLATLFTLPAGYRPSLERRLAIAGGDGGSFQLSWLLIRITGDVQVQMPGSVGTIDEAHIEAIFAL